MVEFEELPIIISNKVYEMTKKNNSDLYTMIPSTDKALNAVCGVYNNIPST